MLLVSASTPEGSIWPRGVLTSSCRGLAARSASPCRLADKAWSKHNVGFPGPGAGEDDGGSASSACRCSSVADEELRGILLGDLPTGEGVREGVRGGFQSLASFAPMVHEVLPTGDGVREAEVAREAAAAGEAAAEVVAAPVSDGTGEVRSSMMRSMALQPGSPAPLRVGEGSGVRQPRSKLRAPRLGSRKESCRAIL